MLIENAKLKAEKEKRKDQVLKLRKEVDKLKKKVSRKEIEIENLRKSILDDCELSVK